MPSTWIQASALALAAALSSAQTAAAAQNAPARQDESPAEAPRTSEDASGVGDEATDVVVVNAVRQRGLTLSDVEPEVTLTEEDIAAYGVSSLAELLEQLAPETSSGRGRRGGGQPVVLLNGRRISGFREIGRYPPEALARVEVLPEEVALSYGFAANQRVINFVLKPNVVVKAAEGELNVPEAGGTTETEGSFQRLSVNGDKRFSFDVEYRQRSPLLESERDFISEEPPVPYARPGNLGADDFGDPIGEILGGDPSFTVAALQGDTFDAPIIGGQNAFDEQDFRTLRNETEDWSVGFSRSQDFFAKSVLTVNGQYERSESEGLLGVGTLALDLPSTNPFVPFDDGLTLYVSLPEAGPLRQDSETETYSGGLSVVSKPGRTNWTFTASVDDTLTDVLTDLVIDEEPYQTQIDAGADPFVVLAQQPTIEQRRTETDNLTASAELVVNAKPVELPAGDLTLTAQGSFRTRRQDTTTEDSSGVVATELTRDTLNGQISIDIPITDGDFSDFGDFSFNANASVSELSDFGTLTSFGGGFNWRPNDKLRVLVSHTREEGAPSISELGDPLLVTPNVRVFDFSQGETVLVDSTTGGNPDLIADTRDVTKVGLQIKPWEKREVRLNIDYTQSLLEDEARSFPALTEEVEAAFPERFTRDADGTLVAIDQRPVNFDESTRRQVRTGLVWSKSVGQSARGGGRPGGGRPPGAGGGRPSGVQGGPGTGRPNTGGQAPSNRPPSNSGQQGSGRPPASQQSAAPNANAGRRAANRQPTRSGRPGRQTISIFHTYVIDDVITIAEGVPELDLLNGSTINNFGGTPRHQVSAVYRRWNKGLGMFANVNWNSPTEVDGGSSGGEDLEFSGVLRANYRLSYDLGFSGAIMQRAPWLRETRVSLGVDNIFNDRIDVEDASGNTPLRFQQDLIDPIGRSFEIEIRKRF